MQCVARAQQLEKRVTCGVSLLVRLARAGRCDPLTRGVALGLPAGLPMVVSTFATSTGDGNLLRKAEWMLLREVEGEELVEVSAAASASNSAGGDSTSKGEAKCWLVVAGAPLMVTCSDRAHFASTAVLLRDITTMWQRMEMQELQLACSTRHAQAAHPDCICMQYIASRAATLQVRVELVFICGMNGFVFASRITFTRCIATTSDVCESAMAFWV